MNFFKRVQRLFGGEQPAAPARPAAPRPPAPQLPAEEAEIVVPEITVDALQAALAQAEPPLVIDVREPYEWRLVRMSAARHVPMNDIPAQLATIPRDRPVVVICAHGSRSYSVAAWLIEQGIPASSLAGGITQWAKQGGAVEQG